MLDGKAALVTGAGRGIGRGIALALAQAGAKVVVNDLGTSLSGEGAESLPADQVVDEILTSGGTAEVNRGNVASFDDATEMVNQVIRSFGKIDILVNVAGILRDRMIFNMTEAEWDAVIAVHLKGTFNCTRAASIPMREQHGGRIVSMSSVSALGSPGQPNYAAAKAGIVALTLATAQGCAAYGVTANAICPRAATAMTSPVFDGAEDEKRELFSPAQVAQLVAYLGRRDTTAITGQVFVAYANIVHLLEAPEVAQTFRAPGSAWDADALSAALGGYFDGSPPPGFAAHGVLDLATDLWRRPSPTLSSPSDA
jgi:NAD(P)-dependent dehydrogenase (short-subunit alcohol dehydrogenase family)